MIFKVDHHEYQAEPMNAFEQFDVARLLRNVLAGLAMVTEAVDKAKNPRPSSHSFVQLMCTMAGGLTQEESDTAIRLCLSKVSRKQQGGLWAPILIADSGQLMFSDILMPQMLEIVWNVLKLGGLIDFFIASPSTSEGEKSPKDGSTSPTSSTGSSDQPLRVSAITRR